jgi:hypothetical protein
VIEEICASRVEEQGPNPAPAVPAAIRYTKTPTAGGINGATLEENMAVSSVVSSQTTK